MKALSFREILERLDKWKFPKGVDGVMGIAGGGVVPAALVAERLGVELRVVSLNYRDEQNEPRFHVPRVLAPVPDVKGWKKMLLVDDVWVSGASWKAARALFPEEIEVLPFVMKGKVEWALIQDINGCVQWPWKPLK